MQKIFKMHACKKANEKYTFWIICAWVSENFCTKTNLFLNSVCSMIFFFNIPWYSDLHTGVMLFGGSPVICKNGKKLDFIVKFESLVLLAELCSLLPASWQCHVCWELPRGRESPALLTPWVCFPTGFLGSLHQRLGPLPHPLLVSHESAGAR